MRRGNIFVSLSDTNNQHSARYGEGFTPMRATRGMRGPSSSFYPEDDEDSKNIRCGGISLVAALVLIVSGLFLMNVSNYEKARTSLEDEYNDGVNKWTEQYLSQFNQTTWELVVDDTTIPLVHSSEQDKMGKGVTNEDLISYTPLKFTLPEIMPVSGEEPTELDVEEGEDPVQVERKRSNATTASLLQDRKVKLVVRERGVFGKVSEIQMPATPILRRVERKASGWKNCKYQLGGYFMARSHTCVTYSALNSMCIKVGRDAGSGEWVVSERYGGAGCSARGLWEPYTWRRVHAPPNGQLPTATPDMLVVFPTTTVRSVEDPYMLGQNLTDGSMVFAESEAEELATGMVLVIVGCIALLPACLLVGPTIKYFRQRRRKEMYYGRQLDETP